MLLLPQTHRYRFAIKIAKSLKCLMLFQSIFPFCPVFFLFIFFPPFFSFVLPNFAPYLLLTQTPFNLWSTFNCEFVLSTRNWHKTRQRNKKKKK